MSNKNLGNISSPCMPLSKETLDKPIHPRGLHPASWSPCANRNPYLLVKRRFFVVDDLRCTSDFPRALHVLCRACRDYFALVVMAEELGNKWAHRAWPTNDKNLPARIKTQEFFGGNAELRASPRIDYYLQQLLHFCKNLPQDYVLQTMSRLQTKRNECQ